ncbi:MAG: NRDE family protein [Ectothiorhodospiraceae bacterium AqS1]|nr:NRDE family protein [Ectothiorhodospiraceae bacterium AqS1]
MCLIYLAWRAHPRFDLVVAANRDEWHARKAAPVAWWDDAPRVLAGRDMEAGGAWMGVARPLMSDRRLRFAAITNYREIPIAPGSPGHDPPSDALPAPPSRGELVLDFLAGGEGRLDSAFDYSREVHRKGRRYRGFCLLVMDDAGLYFVSNRGAQPYPLAPGVYGLSNHLLDTPWPKVIQGKDEMRRLLRSPHSELCDFFSLLTSRAIPPDACLPDTGVGIERERFLSPRFIVGDDYGTRASTVLCLKADGSGSMTERRFGALGNFEDERVFRIDRAGAIERSPKGDREKGVDPPTRSQVS